VHKELFNILKFPFIFILENINIMSSFYIKCEHKEKIETIRENDGRGEFNYDIL
jgi:hypothetical protein